MGIDAVRLQYTGASKNYPAGLRFQRCEPRFRHEPTAVTVKAATNTAISCSSDPKSYIA